MATLLELFRTVESFLDDGGPVLIAIFAVTASMWTLIVERFLFLRFAYPARLGLAALQWSRRKDRDSWIAKQIHRKLLDELRWSTEWALPVIKTMLAVCPLLGLLGTVSGMTEVFDVMAVAESSNPRAMAAGVSHATIPTMAGMVAALSGLYFVARLERLTVKARHQATEELVCCVTRRGKGAT